MYTQIRAKVDVTSTMREHFANTPQLEGSKPSRVDLFEREKNFKKREEMARSALGRRRDDSLQRFDKRDLVMAHFDPLINPKEQRHTDLKGDKDLVYYLRAQDPRYTHYSGFFNGKQVPGDVKAVQLDTHTFSCM